MQVIIVNYIEHTNKIAYIPIFMYNTFLEFKVKRLESQITNITVGWYDRIFTSIHLILEVGWYDRIFTLIHLILEVGWYYTITVFCWGQYEFFWTLKTIFTEAFRLRWILIFKIHKTSYWSIQKTVIVLLH